MFFMLQTLRISTTEPITPSVLAPPPHSSEALLEVVYLFIYLLFAKRRTFGSY